MCHVQLNILCQQLQFIILKAVYSAPAVNLQFAVPKFHLIKKENGQYRRKNQSKEYSQEEYYPKEYYMVFIYFFFHMSQPCLHKVSDFEFTG